MSFFCWEKGYGFAIRDFPYSTNFFPFFVRGLCCKPHIDQFDTFFALHFTMAKSTTHRTIDISNLSRHSRWILRTRQLSYLQAASPIHRPINARNDLSPIGWLRFLDSNSSNLINPNAKSWKELRGSYSHCLWLAPNVCSNFHALSQTSLILYYWANQFLAN